MCCSGPSDIAGNKSKTTIFQVSPARRPEPSGLNPAQGCFGADLEKPRIPRPNALSVGHFWFSAIHCHQSTSYNNTRGISGHQTASSQSFGVTPLGAQSCQRQTHRCSLLPSFLSLPHTPLEVSSSCRNCPLPALLLSSGEQRPAQIRQPTQTIRLVAFNQLQLWTPFHKQSSVDPNI